MGISDWRQELIMDMQAISDIIQRRANIESEVYELNQEKARLEQEVKETLIENKATEFLTVSWGTLRRIGHKEEGMLRKLESYK